VAKKKSKPASRAKALRATNSGKSVTYAVHIKEHVPADEVDDFISDLEATVPKPEFVKKFKEDESAYSVVWVTQNA
jgi:hypothetical protein